MSKFPSAGIPATPTADATGALRPTWHGANPHFHCLFTVPYGAWMSVAPCPCAGVRRWSSARERVMDRLQRGRGAK